MMALEIHMFRSKAHEFLYFLARAETMDPLIPNKEIVNLSSPIRLDKLVMFRSVTKLCGEVTFVDVTFVIYPMSSTCLLYYSKASRENLAILGADVSNFRHHYVCAIMPLDNSLVGKRKQKIHVKLMLLRGSVVFYV